MNLEPFLFWKNFRLGTELHIAGTFIYNSIDCFERIEHFYYEHEIFEFLYNISIGIERLEKIAIVLIEHDGSVDQGNFEKSLITHNHVELLHRIKKSRSVKLGDVHVWFLNMLSEFYRTARYDRFSLTSVFSENKDKNGFIEFVKKVFDAEETGMLPSIVNDARIRKGIERIIRKVVTELFRIVKEETRRLNIFTNEILFASKAYKIFVEENFSFERERFLQKEILVLLLNSQNNDVLVDFIKNIPPLPLENNSTTEYVKFLFDIRSNREIVDELDTILEDLPKDIDRFNAVNAIGTDVFQNFDDDDF